MEVRRPKGKIWIGKSCGQMAAWSPASAICDAEIRTFLVLNTLWLTHVPGGRAYVSHLTQAVY
jgi:hypothetical protein